VIKVTWWGSILCGQRKNLLLIVKKKLLLIRTWIYRSGTDFMLLLILFLLGRPLQKDLKLCHFISDRDEIWQDCSSNKYASIAKVGFLIWRCTFKMTVMSDVISRSASTGECTQPPLSSPYAAVSASSWSIVHLYMLFHQSISPGYFITPPPKKKLFWSNSFFY